MPLTRGREAADIDRVTSRLRRGDVVLAALLASAVGQAVLDQGGFKPGARERFGVLALAALAGALAVDRRGARRAARRPLAIVLWLLAGSGALSALWTEGLAGDSLRWGLVTAGYGAVFVSASTLAGRHRRAPATVAAAIAALATISAVIGLIAVAGRDPLFADYIRGTWRPGGTLEYSAALSLLAVSALPVLLSGMCRRSPVLVALAGVGATICTAALALDRSRAELALAALVAVTAIGWPRRTVGASRNRVAAALVVLLATAVAARVIAGAPVRFHAPPHETRTLALLAATCLGPALLWSIGSRHRPSPRGQPRRGVPRRAAAALAAMLLAVSVAGGIAVAAGAGAGAGAGAEAGARPATSTGHSAVTLHGRSGGFWHGRPALWHVAIATAQDHPLIGGGADGFLAASIVHQPSSPIRFAHDLPLELAAELGVAGLMLGLALYGATARELWWCRRRGPFWRLAPAAIAFPAANLIDWPWHLAGSGAIWAAALGALAAREPGGPKAPACATRDRLSHRSADTDRTLVPA